ncbi:hypothetical protein CHS0354_037897 [Potamilus streckersoni]|uniref:protein disulfide-isomerase n=1 Tax=Potamilus streckersoni TaxID=2493646 RepID=A0AAE0W9P0_9BIVA|nr:hypothetical protein CHS0354_037897 [Potamilus streckersoni]
MKSLLCLASVISLVFAGDVLYYSNTEFAAKMPKHDLAMVEFFAPWCEECKMLDPAYEVAAKMLKNNDPPIPLIKVDCTVDTLTCVQYGTNKYPAFKVMRNGKAEDYTGRVVADDIVNYMKHRAGPSSKEMKTVEDVEKFLSSNDYCMMGFFSNNENEMAMAYRKVAHNLRTEMLFAHTSEQAIMDKYGYNDAIIMFQPKMYQNMFEQPERMYEDVASVDKMSAWIQRQRLGLCSERTEQNAEMFKNPLVVVYYDVNFSMNLKTTMYWRNRVMKVAKKFQDAGKEVMFAISNHKVWLHELGTFGLADFVDNRPVFTPKEKPVVTARDTRERKYVMSEEFSEENLEKFVNDMMDGKLEEYMKSEPIPASNDEPVKMAVARNFDEIVNNEKKDVVIEFYAPWCPHCESFGPKYMELAEKLKSEPELTMVKMDATANDIPKPFEYSKFPMIYMVPMGNKKHPKLYTNALEVDPLLKFIAKESTNELKGYNRKGKMKKTEL